MDVLDFESSLDQDVWEQIPRVITRQNYTLLKTTALTTVMRPFIKLFIICMPFKI